MKRLNFLTANPLSFTILLIIITVMSCTKDFQNINTSKTAIATVGKTELPYFLSKAQSTTHGGAFQITENLFSDQYAQFFACTSTSFGTDRLKMNINWINGGGWNSHYSTVVPCLQTIFANTDSTSAAYQIASIWWVYDSHRITDYWGAIPYFKAGQSGLTVSYDAQDKIYADFFKRLKTAVTILKNHTAETPYGSFDYVFGGKVDQWIKLANSLRLRLALRISNVDPTNARIQAEAAVAGGVMTVSPDDDAFVLKSLNDNNPLSTLQYDEFRMSASMESVLKGYQDPRMPIYFMPSKTTGSYEGLRNGLTVKQLTDPSDLNGNKYNSHPGPQWSPPSYIGGVPPNTVTGLSSYLSTHQKVMTTAESYFNRAEGAIKGWNMGGTAQSLYNAGIKNSFLEWGITSNPTSYSNSTNVPIAPDDFLKSPPMTTIPVLFGTTQAVQLEQIATQKWISLYPDGMEGWADYRRNKLVKLYPVAHSDNPLIDSTSISTLWLRRIPFPVKEYQTNKAAVTAAVSLLSPAVDNEMTPLWWDKN